MDIRILKYFLAVAREENMTRASELLHISQPSLSKQMKELESEFGKQFFIRGKRKTTLTEDGMLLRKRAEELIALFDKTQHELSSSDNCITGIVTIGGGAYSTVITQTVSKLHVQFPNIQFDFYNGDAIDVQEKLDNGTLDFGILLDPVDITKYEYIPLPNKDTWGLLMRKDFPLSAKKTIKPHDIKNVPLIIHKRQILQRELSLWCGIEIENLNVIATYNMFFNNPVYLVKSGIGCAFVSSQSIDLHENDNICFRPIYPLSEIQLNIVWKRHQVFSKASDCFLKILREEV